MYADGLVDKSPDEYQPNAGAENVFQDTDPDGDAPVLDVVVPVCVKEPVRTQELPARDGGNMTYDLGAGTQPVKILSEDPRRRRALLIIRDQNIQIGSSKAEAASNYAAVLPGVLRPGMDITRTAAEELWAYATVATSITVINEQWTG